MGLVLPAGIAKLLRCCEVLRSGWFVTARSGLSGGHPNILLKLVVQLVLVGALASTVSGIFVPVYLATAVAVRRGTIGVVLDLHDHLPSVMRIRADFPSWVWPDGEELTSKTNPIRVGYFFAVPFSFSWGRKCYR